MSTQARPEPAPSPEPAGDDTPEDAAAHARVGLILFALYLALYAGFMAASAFAPGLMAATPVAGLNVAVLYGMGLIVTALVLALVYVALCGRGSAR